MSRQRVPPQQRPLPQGFTLVELLVAVAVMGVLAVVAAPSMTALVNTYRVSSTAGELTAALQIARSEAVRRNARVSVCGNAACTSTDWSEIVVVHSAPTADDPAVIRSTGASSGVSVTGPANGIVFRPSGVINAQACVPLSNSYSQYAVTVMVSGLVSNAKGTC
ncbi:GspH/FimT family pseudopilin [Thermomonas carbonis]|uniref:Type II secretion system protein H n=1 Tax=Thermomonas carbonis TaxID=1463158 RepID=A0A7G9SUD5_9GAMM|nr:GspH/FimT family pseudopilin [Thermomonas carbonis]QNN71460.1 GspH/FimT family pseudopilin [Thermomonas carbonis]GHB98293.1 hypothetical protein GCM10010080_08320 [Thermomonas carbonis]